jgi:polysaccharide chain length determinant protein (PEP-CTERM system associated)
MQEQFAEILYYIKATFKYKWLVIIAAWLVCLPAWWFILKMPDKYTSTARVQVDTRSMLRPLLSGLAIQADVKGMVLIMKQLMFTQQNLEAIANLADLGLNDSSESNKNEIVDRLKTNTRIDGGSNEIFSISFDSEDPVEAKHVVQAVLTVFSEQTQKTALDDAGSAQRFIFDQIQEYEQRLRNAEKARESFKKANMNLLPGQGGDQISQIQQLNSTLEEAKLFIEELNSRKEVLKEQLIEAQESGEDEWDLGLESTTSSEDARLTSLKAQRDELLLKYTAKHPSIKVLNENIKSIEADVKKRASETPVAESESPLASHSSANPFAQSIKAALNDVDAQIAAMKSRITAYEAKIKTLDEEFNQRLSIETEMQNLNRDYDTIKGNYQSLLQRKEQASLSEKADNQATALRFKVADPPNKPLKPSAPNRGLLYSAAFGVGIALGIAVAFFSVLIKPTFIAVNQVRNLTGLPVLGSISIISNVDRKKKFSKELVLYGLSWSLLISAYTGIMLFKI